MGLFHSKSIKLEKVENQDEILYLLDYFKYKESDQLLEEVITDFTEGKRFLLELDTDSFYDRKASTVEQKINRMKQELSEQKIDYKEVIVKRDGSTTIFGMKIPAKSKVNSYKLGIAATPDQIRHFISMFQGYNMFCYITKEEVTADELFEMLEKTHGNIEELGEQFSLCLYNDSYFRRIRISGSKDTIKTVGDKLQKYS